MRKMTYEKAKSELEAILKSLQEDLLDLDSLHQNVSRAAELITFCKQKLRETEKKLQDVLEEE